MQTTGNTGAKSHTKRDSIRLETKDSIKIQTAVKSASKNVTAKEVSMAKLPKTRNFAIVTPSNLGKISQNFSNLANDFSDDSGDYEHTQGYMSSYLNLT